ncbi:hypothetical protein ACX80U_10185 [Arthrobacter sp. TmT3-37]
MGRKFSTSVAGVALTMLALTGCSGSAQEATESVAAEVTEAPAETSEAAETTEAPKTTEATASAPAATGPTTLGVATSDLGEIVVDADGMSVYYFTKDLAAGDTNGQAVGDVWYVVAPDGTMIK